MPIRLDRELLALGIKQLIPHVPQLWEFSWSKVPKAEKYYIYIAHSSLMNHPVVSQEIEVPVYRIPNLVGGLPILNVNNHGGLQKGWTWKARAQVGGEWSNWSEVRSFDIESKAE